MNPASALEREVLQPAVHGVRQKVSGFIALTKPRVIELLLVTTLPTMIFAARAFPSWQLILSTMLGGALAAGSAGSFNSYIDRDIDRVMSRTSKRPLVTGVISDREALTFAWVLGIVSLIVLSCGANLLTGILGLVAIVFYVVVYSIILKRRTAQNIVWGGAAGCMPVLIAWAAVTETIQWPAVVLFMVIFLWTPAHYWPLSMRYSEDYTTAHVPMLGAVAHATVVAVQVVLYSWSTVVCSLLLIPVGGAGIIYSAAALPAGAWFIVGAYRLYRTAREGTPTDALAMRVFHSSITYLTVIFVALALDPFLGVPLMR